jgi:hypothetical protein
MKGAAKRLHQEIRRRESPWMTATRSLTAIRWQSQAEVHFFLDIRVD